MDALPQFQIGADMAGPAESERELRAKIIDAEGAFQAAAKLVEAACMIAAQPIALTALPANVSGNLDGAQQGYIPAVAPGFVHALAPKRRPGRALTASAWSTEYLVLLR
jgi:hypothetical protein